MVRDSLHSRSLENLVHLACLIECTARKPGNVHPESSFSDVTYQDFVASAETIAPVLSRTPEIGIGRAILESVQATRQRVGSNTNLGIILLLAPLCHVPAQISLKDGIAHSLASIDLQQTEMAFQAIREASPGGLGKSDTADVSSTPTMKLVEAMKFAAHKDSIAREYVTDFRVVLDSGFKLLQESLSGAEGDLETAIIVTQLRLMAETPDSLIFRKNGERIASESQRLAQQVLESNWTGGEYTVELQAFDTWLRADGNRRNPGTTADLIAGILFAYLRDTKTDLDLRHLAR